MAESKTLLLLGGSADQMFAIRTAKAMGLRVLVVDQNPASPGFAAADDYRVISTRDVPALTAFADEYQRSAGKIDGVFVQGSDIPHVVARVAEHLGTPHIPIEAADIAVHKLRMKQTFARAGVSVPWFSALSSREELQEVITEQGLPLVIKPVDRSGSRGVFLLRSGAEADELFPQSVAASLSGQVMVEKYVAGPQISTESIIFNGAVYTPGFVDRNYEHVQRYAPRIIENGGWNPSSANDGVRRQVDVLIMGAARALGINAGILKGDIVVGPNGPMIIEVAARPSGGDFSESLMVHGVGVNIVEAAIRIAIGEAPDLEALRPKFQRAIANRYFFPPAGRLRAVQGADAVAGQPWVRKFELWYKPGDAVPEIRSHADRFGVFVIEAADRDELEERIRWVYEQVRIEVEPI